MLKLDIDPRPQIAHLDITTRRLVATNFMGDYQSVFKGRGVIFESYRDYCPADDASLIDWKASTRAGKALIKEYVEERNLDVFFLIDASHTMVFGSQKKLKHEYAAEMVASMAFAILDRGDSVGVGLFSDKVRGFLMPMHGIAQYRRIIRELTESAHYDGPKCDLEEAVRACLHRLPPQTLLILITDAVGWEGEWHLPLKIANRKFEVIVILVRDPRDDELPSGVGQVAVENPGTGEQLLLDTDHICEDYARVAAEIKEHHIRVLHASGMTDVPVIRTDQEFPRHILAFFERRKRKLR